MPFFNDVYHCAERPPEIEMIRNMARESVDRNRPPAPGADPRYDCADDLFEIRTANSWFNQAKGHHPPKMLFGNFWFENELCILFADTNLGKSILAVQLGNLLATGACIDQFPSPAQPAPVLYFDFEQSAAQFEARYTHGHPFTFSPNFYRAELNAAAGEVRNYLDRVHASIEEGLRKTMAKYLIIDNLTYLSNSAVHAGSALAVIKFLKMIKSKHNISILVLAHTPKRNPAKPITNNDMQGSKMLLNFCDSAFAMGRSHKDSNLRYLKQIKQRNTQQTFAHNHAFLFTIERSGGWLFFQSAGGEAEEEHLLKNTYMSITDRRAVAGLHAKGHSNRKIAAELGISRSSVARILAEEQ